MRTHFISLARFLNTLSPSTINCACRHFPPSQSLLNSISQNRICRLKSHGRDSAVLSTSQHPLHIARSAPPSGTSRALTSIKHIRTLSSISTAMEKFSQYRDRGTQIAPFLEIPSPRTLAQLPLSITLLCLRLPFFLFLFIAYFGVLQWLPIGSLVRKACLWMILLVCGVWWVDLQVEGVRKGSLSKQSKKLPRAGTVIVSSFTSPIDILYLAAVFDPIFTASYPNTREIERLSLLPAIIRSLSPPLSQPPPGTKLIPLSRLLAENPNRSIALFPECTPTNGRGILRFSPSLDSTPENTPIFPISIRYTPADVTTPVPGWSTAGKFVWRLFSGGTHCVRVRIAGEIYNTPREERKRTYDGIEDEGYGEEVDENGYGSGSGAELKRRVGGAGGEEKEKPQSELCVKGGEALARIGRVKRLNLGVKEKMEFVQAWVKNKKGVWHRGDA